MNREEVSMGSLVAPAADNYFEALGLAFDPFAAGAMPEFFFVGGQRRYLTQRAVHLLYFSGAMVLLLGACGTGKSHLLDEVSTELHELADICRIEANVMMDAVQLRARLADVAKLPAEAAHSAVDLVLALANVRPGAEEPQPIMVLIDSAHVLAIDTLAETVALAQSSGGRVRLLLAGEGELATSWQQASAGTAEVLQLPNLDRAETADYLHTRLQAGGAARLTPLDSMLLDTLFAQSGGNIGAIHTLAPQLLAPMQQTTSPAQRIRALPVLHICALAALLALIIILFLYRGHGTDTNPSGAVEREKEAVPAIGNRQSVALALPVAAQASTPVTAAVHSKPSSAAVTATVTLSLPVPSPLAVTSAAQPPVTELPESKPAPNEVSKPAPKVVETKPAPVKPAASAVETSKPVDQAMHPKATTGAGANEHELLGMASNQFVLQLLGAESPSTIDKFVASAGRGQRLLTYHTRLRGKPWMIVLTGPYPSKEAALAAVAKMPEALRKQQPWPRSVANVQADIRAHSEKF
jgi:septal ring-binding cell division protein DamX/type II secretory pathway predicted ATPase ExeA